MINSHILTENKLDKELYLYLDFDFEIGFNFNLKEINKQIHSFNDKIIAYIKTKEIDFNKGKVFIVVGGVILGSLYLHNNQISNSPPPPPKTYEVAPIEKKIDKVEETDENKEEQKEEQKEEDKEDKENNEDKEVKKNEEKKEIISTSKPDSVPKEEPIPIPKPTSKPDVEIEPKPIEEIPPILEKQITLHRSNGQIITLNLEDYIIGVVGAEMPASFNIEALKAQSVVARTYALKKVKRQEILTDTVSNQVYKNNNELKTLWGSEFDKYYNKVKTAVTNTTNETLVYNDDYIEAVYHSTSNGKTEDAIFVWGNSFPYLKSVDSHWDLNASSYLRETTKDFNTLKAITGIDFNEETNIEIISKTSGDRINEIKINDTIFTGVELRTLLGLRSADFDITFNNNNSIFTTRGYGHGVGMSQYGANGMANDGYNYVSILNHYYPGTTIKK